MIVLTLSNSDYEKLCSTLKQKHVDDDFKDKELEQLIDDYVYSVNSIPATGPVKDMLMSRGY